MSPKFIATCLFVFVLFLLIKGGVLIFSATYDIPQRSAEIIIGLGLVSVCLAALYLFKFEIVFLPILSIMAAYGGLNRLIYELVYLDAQSGITSWYASNYVTYGLPVSMGLLALFIAFRSK